IVDSCQQGDRRPYHDSLEQAGMKDAKMTGQNRKNQLKALFQPVEIPAAEGAAQAPAAPAAPSVSAARPAAAQPDGRVRSASGAVKAMGLSLGGLSREIEDARRLKESLGAADRVVEIEPQLIDTSFVSDRLG